MDKKNIKTGIALISYTAVLVLFVVYIKEIFLGINTLAGYAGSFFIGILIALFLNPPYRMFMRIFKKIHFPTVLARLLSTIFVLAIAIGIIYGIVIIVIPQVSVNAKIFFSNFNTYLNTLQDTLDFYMNKLNLQELDIKPVANIIESIVNKFQEFIISLGPKAITYTKLIISSITKLLIGIVFSIYLLNSKDRILMQLNRLNKAVLGDTGYKVVSHIGKVAINTFDSYVVGQIIEAIILGVLCFLGMRGFGFSYAEMISVIVAVTALLPMIGAFIGGFVGFLVYLLVDPIKALLFLGFFIVLQQIENNLIYPRVVGRKVGLPGVWILLAVLIGSRIGGLIGAICGVPAFTIVYTLLKDLTIYKEQQKKIKKRKKREQKFNALQADAATHRLTDEEYQHMLDKMALKKQSEMDALMSALPTDDLTDEEKIERAKQASYKNMELDDKETVAVFIPHGENIEKIAKELEDDLAIDDDEEIPSPVLLASKAGDEIPQKPATSSPNMGFFSNKLRKTLHK